MKSFLQKEGIVMQACMERLFIRIICFSLFFCPFSAPFFRARFLFKQLRPEAA